MAEKWTVLQTGQPKPPELPDLEGAKNLCREKLAIYSRMLVEYLSLFPPFGQCHHAHQDDFHPSHMV
jgi:hypothetical protein